VNTLKDFLTIDNVVTLPDPMMVQEYTWADMLLVLGNSYIDQLVNKPFNYYK
jgi:hypothetical protein